MIDYQYLQSLLDYDQRSGVLTWRPRPRPLFKTHRAFVQWNQRYAGQVAGTLKPDSGYVAVSIHKRHYRAHQLIWCLVHCVWPDGEIDHINGIRNDNRLENLRLVSKEQNAKNKRLSSRNKTGYHGITITPHGRFRAKGYQDGRQCHIGYFMTLEDAALARKQFEQKAGFHPNHGRSYERAVA